jgi:transposase
MTAKCPKTISPVARLYNINPRTGQRWWAKYKENPDTFFEIKPRGYVKKLNIEHKGLLVKLFDKDPAATIEDAIEELSANFEGIKISSTAVHDFLKVELHFMLRRGAMRKTWRRDTSGLLRLPIQMSISLEIASLSTNPVSTLI